MVIIQQKRVGYKVTIYTSDHVHVFIITEANPIHPDIKPGWLENLAITDHVMPCMFAKRGPARRCHLRHSQQQHLPLGSIISAVIQMVTLLRAVITPSSVIPPAMARR